MTVIEFAGCRYSVLRETSWNDSVKVISDQTRSRASRRRLGGTAQPRSFSATFSFPTKEDYDIFMDWFDMADLCGFHPFRMERIDSVSGGTAVYRFAGGTSLASLNVGGHVMQVTAELEEVRGA